MGTEKKIKLVYILCIGHSGSTLLDILLGSHSNIFSVGEINHLEKYHRNDLLCTCKKVLSSCDFWKDVLAAYRIQTGSTVESDNYFGFTPVKVSRLRKILAFLLGYEVVFSDHEIEKYGYSNYQIFNIMLKKASKTVILDSSKNRFRLFLLLKSGYFDIKIIYLFRDGRSILDSIKRKATNSKREKRAFRGSLYHTIEFVINSLLIRNLLKKQSTSDEVYKMQYEEFTEKVDDEIANVFSFLNLTKEENLLPKANSRIKHNIGGNRLRFANIDTIHHRKQWEKSLTKKELFLFRIFGGDLINRPYNW